MNRTAETVETQRRLSELETGVLQKLSSSWLAADRTPPAFVRFSVSLLLFLTRSCSVDGVR